MFGMLRNATLSAALFHSEAPEKDDGLDMDKLREVANARALDDPQWATVALLIEISSTQEKQHMSLRRMFAEVLRRR